MHVRGHEHFIRTKFCKQPLSSSVVKADYVFPYIYMYALVHPLSSPKEIHKKIINIFQAFKSFIHAFFHL